MLKYDYEEHEEDFIAFCVDCGKEIEQIEAHQHMFVLGGFPVCFHKNCCPQELENHLCYNH